MDTNRIKKIIDEIETGRIDRHLRYFCGYEKLSGEKEALKTVDYINEVLAEQGIACKTETFDAYLSNPLESVLEVGGRIIPSRPRSFSGTCEGLEAVLAYDPNTREAGMTETQKDAFYRTLKGKIVVGYGFDERYAKVLEQYGAAAWIQVWTSGEAQIHEDTVSPVWGTPDMDSCFLRLNMPVAAISGPEGERLIKQIKQMEQAERPLTARLSNRVETGVKEVALPVAEIKGESEDFVMISCHYDTWYIGAFDNCTANAAALEIARVLNRNRELLKRSVRIAWWPGHSNGRYMGSAWYCDHHFDELYEHCIAHLNMDLLGSKGTDETLAVRTAGLEGEDFVRELAGLTDPSADIVFGSIGRGADQSFWGADIPYHINPRYEARASRKESSAPGPGRYWWHTAEDTYDKIDLPVLRKDAGIVCSLALGFLVEEGLPVDADCYFNRISLMLCGLKINEESLPVIREIRDKFTEVRAVFDKNAVGRTKNEAAILAGGVISRLLHSSGSPYEQDTAFAYGPGHLLGASCGADKGNSPADRHLFCHTTLVRQRNRMVTELNRLIRELERMD